MMILARPREKTGVVVVRMIPRATGTYMKVRKVSMALAPIFRA